MKHKTKLKKVTDDIIKDFAKSMQVQFEDIEEVDYLRVYSFADMWIDFSEIMTALEYKLTYQQFSDWYWNYRIEGSAKKINLENYSKFLNLKS
jgi:predicted GH43/DUF377 family glycosyl hydrolase